MSSLVSRDVGQSFFWAFLWALSLIVSSAVIILMMALSSGVVF